MKLSYQDDTNDVEIYIALKKLFSFVTNDLIEQFYCKNAKNTKLFLNS